MLMSFPHTPLRPARVPTSPVRGDFWTYWAGQTISTLGSSFTLFVLPLLIFTLTGSSLDLALTVAAAVLPYLLFGLVIGAWVDRVDRKRVMIVADLARTLIIASIPLGSLFGLFAAFSVWWIYAVAFLSSACAMGFDAANFAAVPSLVPAGDLVRANGRIQGGYSAARVVGPLLAGLLLLVVPLPMLLLIDAASFLVSAASLALVRTSFQSTAGEQRSATSLRQDIREGLHYVLGHPVLRSITLLLFLINFLLPTVTGQLVLFAKEQLDASNAQVGFLYASGGLGTVLLSFLAGQVGKRWSAGVVALRAVMVQGVLIAVMALMGQYWAVLPLWGFRGGADSLFVINTYSLAQTLAPRQLLGRVITFTRILTWSTGSLGVLLGGLAIEQTQNVALVYGVIGVLIFSSALLFSFTPLAHAERYLPATPAPPLTELPPSE